MSLTSGSKLARQAVDVRFFTPEEFKTATKRVQDPSVEVVRCGGSKINIYEGGRCVATITAGMDYGTVECPENHIQLEALFLSGATVSISEGK